ncbi:hypothetical protein GCK72_021531 [Caenorhabditis remanei]|uniref:GATA-type domain-containing protein n=1 Tax=Caenorhabditis remanei TaxID=31234 RepID=A0A6A5GK88_CAERE|nr:hypothetical protein GCK72_021531 [Caenorhabditis remanei]KAF1754965.1 hypothetical protein GCK72_021531 [Caenorhabditis remanei]
MAEFSSFYSSLYNSRGLTTPRLVETPTAPPNPHVDSPVPFSLLETPTELVGTPATLNPSVGIPSVSPALCYRYLHKESVEAVPQQLPYPMLPGYPGYQPPFLRPMSPIMKHPLFGYTPETNSQQVPYWPPSQIPFPEKEDPDIEVVYENIHVPNCYNPSSPQKAPNSSNLCSTKSQESQNKSVPNSSQKNANKCQLFEDQKCANSGKDQTIFKTVRRRVKHETICANALCKRALLPGKFNVHPVTNENVCIECCWYYKRNGKDREVILMRRKIDAKRRAEKLETNCSNTFCNLPLPPGKHATHPITKEKICVACYAYYEITGGTGDSVGAKIKQKNAHEDPTNGKGVASADIPESPTKLITVLTSEHVPIIEPTQNFERSKQNSDFGAWTTALASNTENPAICCQEESIAHQPGKQQKDAQSDKCANNLCKGTLFPRNIRYHPITKEKICRTCYNYYIKEGKDRGTEGRKEQYEISCANTFCKKLIHPKNLRTHPVTETKICYSCYIYYKRNGRDREVIQIHTRRKEHETNCSIPSCHSLITPDSASFHLPSTGMLVCCNCYKLYLKSEYERVIAAERLAVNEKSECDSPLPEGCKSSVGNNSAPVSDLNEDLIEIESSDDQASPNISEDIVEECPVQLDLENPAQITHENIIQEPPKETCEKCMELIRRKPIMFVKLGVRTKLCHDCYKIVRSAPQSEEPVGQEVAASRSKKCTTCNKSKKRKRKVFAGQQKNKLRTHPETGELTCRGCLMKYYRNEKQKEKMFGRVPNTNNSQEDTLQGDNNEEQVDGRQETEQNTPCASSSQECESKSLTNVSSASPTTIPNNITSDYSNHIQPVNHNHGTQWHFSDIYRSQQLKDSQEYNFDHDPNPIPPLQYQEPTNIADNYMDKREAYHHEMHFNSSYGISNTYQPQHGYAFPIDASEDSAETVSYTTLEAVPSISSSFVRKDLEHFVDNCEKLNDDNFSDQAEKDTQVDNSCPIDACDFQSESIQKQPDEEENKELSPEKENCANTICRSTLLPQKNAVHPVTKEKICTACFNYYKRNGRNREVIVTKRRREKHETHCANTLCKQLLLQGRNVVHPATKERICDLCYDYFKRNGRDREVVAGKVKKFKRDKYESESDTTSISSDDSSIEESSESDSDSDSSEMDCE